MSYSASNELAQFEGARARSLSNYQNLLAERDTRLAALRENKGPASDRWKRLEIKLRNAEARILTISARLQRGTDAKHLPFMWAFLAAIVLAILEAPINKFMLDNILQGNNIDSYVISLFLTLIMLLLAHFAGHQARQIRGAYQETIYPSNIAILVFSGIVLIFCVGALTIGRAYYSTANFGSGGSDIFSEVTRQVLHIGPLTAFITALSDKAAFFLACMNTAGISAAFIIAFVTHDSDRIYQAALDDERSADRRLSRMEQRYVRNIGKIASKFSPKLAISTAAYGAENAQVIELKRDRGIQLTEDDRFDLNSLDTVLQSAKAELALKPRQNTVEKAYGTETPDTEAQTVSPFVARR